MPRAAPASRPNAATSPARGVGSARPMRIRNSVAPIIAAAKGMSLVWLNMVPYQAPQTLSPTAAISAARGPAINRAVAAAAPIPPMPISAHRMWRRSYGSIGIRWLSETAAMSNRPP